MIGTYALCSILGVLVCGAMATLLGRRENIAVEDIIMTILMAMMGVAIGGCLLYGMTNLPTILRLLQSARNGERAGVFRAIVAQFSGSVFYGGMLMSLLTVRLYLRRGDREFQKRLFEIYVISIPLFHAFGRVGCFFGGCCFGREWPWGVLVTENVLSPAINGVVRFPVALFEAGGNLLLFVLLLLLFLKKKKRLLVVYWLLYASMRFVLEFYRGDVIRGIWWGLSTSQWISLVLIVISVGVLLHDFLKSWATKKNI